MNLSSEFSALISLHGLISLVILSLLELILGVDNIIFISLLLTKVPDEKRFNTRATALSLAFIMRIIMLFLLVWLSRITTTLFTISTFQVSIRDILFLIGGTYLIFNTVKELIRHHQITKPSNHQISFKSIILQIVIVDLLFSFDSVFTAIGIIPNLLIIVLAVGIGVVCMVYISGRTSVFIEKNPTVKTLALCFIIAVGLLLVTEAFHFEIPKEYLYAILVIALIIERIYNTLKN